MSATFKVPNCLHYGFSFHGSEVFCREGYEGAEALLSHLTNVGPLLEEALKLAELTRLEVQGVEQELAKLLEPPAALNPTAFGDKNNWGTKCLWPTRGKWG